MSKPVAIVTGASRGIGRGIALDLARHGFSLVCNYHQSAEAAEQVVAEIQAAGAEGVSLRANVAERADRQRLVDQALQQFGRLDVLVNNAGITSLGRKDILEATEDSWDQVFGTNLKGPFFLSQRAAQVMVGLVAGQQIEHGTIVNVSSISAYAATTNRADYCIAKAGIRMMTQLFATRLAEESIRVFEVCPGVIASDMTSGVQEKYDRLIAEGLTPIRRWGQPADVAKAVSMLVSNCLAFSTGECINVDGGFHIRRL